MINSLIQRDSALIQTYRNKIKIDTSYIKVLENRIIKKDSIILNKDRIISDFSKTVRVEKRRSFWRGITTSFEVLGAIAVGLTLSKIL